MNKPVKPLNETEQLIYEYIEAHLDEIPALSSKELGRRTATSAMLRMPSFAPPRCWIFAAVRKRMCTLESLLLFDFDQRNEQAL